MHVLIAVALVASLLYAARMSAASTSYDHRDERPAARHVHDPVKLADADILPSSASRELSILYYLAIARGHLLASMELARSGKLDQSVLHSRHALDEAWVELVPLLSTEDAQALRPRIESMNESIALKLPLPQILSAHDEARKYIDNLAADYYVEGTEVHQTVAIILLLLKQALAEYEEAWDNLQLRNRAEYQDGFAFVAVANTELRQIAPALRAKNAEAAAVIQSTVDRLAGAWPSAEPPERALMSKPLLRALVTAVELHARQFLR
jgi:hypothetical protein